MSSASLMIADWRSIAFGRRTLKVEQRLPTRACAVGFPCGITRHRKNSAAEVIQCGALRGSRGSRRHCGSPGTNAIMVATFSRSKDGQVPA